MSLRPQKFKSQSTKLRRERAEKRKQPKGVSGPNGSILSVVLPTKVIAPRRNKGRMDGVTWNGSSFICNKHIEDGLVPWDLSETSYADREDYGISECEMDHADSPVVRPMTIILSDIARPAKQRGVARDFEFVDSLQRVIVEDDFEEDFDYSPADEDWELYDEEWALPTNKSYSAIVRGHDR
ncbi:hypothetical protein HWV62_41136 [Athelia sp. TMB]|nr:hypothetical protein HWV62_41136 [Athelia sp. TMB]